LKQLHAYLINALEALGLEVHTTSQEHYCKY